MNFFQHEKVFGKKKIKIILKFESRELTLCLNLSSTRWLIIRNLIQEVQVPFNDITHNPR